MFQVGEELSGYKVVSVEGDYVTINSPAGFNIGFSVTGITGGLREVLGLIGVTLPE